MTHLMHQHGRTQRHRRGLTLVELVLALGFLAAVLALTYLMYVNYVSAFASAETQFNAQQEARLVLDEISREIRYALEFEAYADGSGLNPRAFIHDGTSVIYRTNSGDRIISDSIDLLRFTAGANNRFVLIEVEATVRDRTVSVETEVLLLNTSFTGVNGGSAVEFTKP